MERPILFSGPMVRAILSGAKTQTRRVAKVVGWNGQIPETVGLWIPGKLDSGWGATYVGGGTMPGGRWQQACIRCPYGQPGDRLWVRETWTPVDRLADDVEREDPTCIGYAADQAAMRYERGIHEPSRLVATPLDTSHFRWDRVRWRPSIHMPRWASRLTLEVTGVRVERLQQIGDEDTLAEGVTTLRVDPALNMGGDVPATVRFRHLWDQINGKRAPWASNPWVWVVSFKLADRAERGR